MIGFWSHVGLGVILGCGVGFFLLYLDRRFADVWKHIDRARDMLDSVINVLHVRADRQEMNLQRVAHRLDQKPRVPIIFLRHMSARHRRAWRNP